MLCFPQLVHSPKTPRQELLPLPSAALWGSPKGPSWLLLSGDQHWACPHQPRTARTQNTVVLLCPLNLCVSGIPLPRILQNSQPVHSGLSLFMVIVLVAATSRMLFPLYRKSIRFLHMLPFHALDLIETCFLISCRWM